MGRKKKNRNIRFRKGISRRSSLDSSGNTLPKELSFDQWKSQMPQWLKKAETAVELGKREEAAQILSPQRIEQVLKEQSGPEGIFIIYGMANVLHRLGQATEAEELYKEILKTHPVSPG